MNGNPTLPHRTRLQVMPFYITIAPLERHHWTPLNSVLLTNLVLRSWFGDSELALRPLIADILGLAVDAAYALGHIQPLSCPHIIRLAN